MPTFKPQYKDKNGIIQDLNIDYNSLANKPTTKNEIESLKSNINTLDKRVTSIESRLSDRIFKVDSDLAYTKTVPAGALPYASIDTLGGITKKYNQLSNLAYDTGFGYKQTVNGMDITFYNGYIICNGTSTDNISIAKAAKIIANHKYINKGGKSNAFGRFDYYDPDIINLETSSINNNYYSITILSGTTYNNKKIPVYLVDLTAMYGAGNEPTTVAQFLADNPMYNDYVPYTEGDIANTNVTSIDSVGVNIWDEEWEVGGYWTDGTKNDTVNNGIRNKTPIEVIPNETYYIYFGNTALVGLYIHFYDKDMTKIGSSWNYQDKKNSTINVPSNCCYMNIFAPSYGITYNHDISIYEGTENLGYIPYFSYNFPIPSSIQSLEGYGWGVNDSLYNYIDFERKKFVKRVGRVDLGTVDWIYGTWGKGNCFTNSSDISNIKPYTNYSSKANILCSIYTTETADNVYIQSSNMIVCLNNSILRIINTSYTDATAFKSAMSGVYLYYELATPVITDISNILTDDNFIKVEANGTLTFENTYKNAVPSKIAYLVEVK